jgi:hypothetical protein
LVFRFGAAFGAMSGVSRGMSSRGVVYWLAGGVTSSSVFGGRISRLGVDVQPARVIAAADRASHLRMIGSTSLFAEDRPQ